PGSTATNQIKINIRWTRQRSKCDNDTKSISISITKPNRNPFKNCFRQNDSPATDLYPTDLILTPHRISRLKNGGGNHQDVFYVCAFGAPVHVVSIQQMYDETKFCISALPAKANRIGDLIPVWNRVYDLIMALRQLSSFLIRGVTPCGLLSRESGLLRHNHLINTAKPIITTNPNRKTTSPSEISILSHVSGCCSYSTSATHRLIGNSSNTVSPRISSGLLISAFRPSPSPLLKPVGPLLTTSTRNVIKCSLGKGRRKTVKAVIHRFYRLDWGAWISPKPGRARHLWKKSAQRRQRLRYHLFRTSSENRMLERMMTKYWVKKKHFVDDPYETYHTRDNFPITKGVQGIDSTWLRKIKSYRHPRKSPFT
ncbi:39S ribosomal protein L35, mitochondrial, partial [Orchesella cincta]